MLNGVGCDLQGSPSFLVLTGCVVPWEGDGWFVDVAFWFGVFLFCLSVDTPYCDVVFYDRLGLMLVPAWIRIVCVSNSNGMPGPA